MTNDPILCPHCKGDISAVIAENSRRVGAKGGNARWANMTPEERSAANQNVNHSSAARVRAARKAWETRRAKAATKLEPPKK